MHPDRRGKLEKVLTREQYAPRVSPEPKGRPEPIKLRPKTREGPNVVSEYFVHKNCRERARNFWKKPWGRYKVDLPLPSYLRDFKYADNQLLRPHFAHYRRNVGIGRNAEKSLEMLRSLSAPPYPSVRGEEHTIVGAYDVGGVAQGDKGRLPMIGLPKRVPLENPVEMEKLRKTEYNVERSQNGNSAPKATRKKASPEKMGLFLDELTEAYALCSAHEQLTAEMANLQKKTSKLSASKGMSEKLPQLGLRPTGALDTLHNILESRKLKK